MKIRLSGFISSYTVCRARARAEILFYDSWLAQPPPRGFLYVAPLVRAFFCSLLCAVTASFNRNKSSGLAEAPVIFARCSLDSFRIFVGDYYTLLTDVGTQSITLTRKPYEVSDSDFPEIEIYVSGIEK